MTREITTDSKVVKRPLEEEKESPQHLNTSLHDQDDENDSDDYELEQEMIASNKRVKSQLSQEYQGLYLETVNRSMLDFDFEKLCSVSLSNLNIYACLVCGKYFQGRGKSSHAYFHSMNEDHHVFIHLESLSVYILPDGHQVHDISLQDIQFIIKPTFTPDQVASLDKTLSYSLDLNKKKYLPGFIGLNNIKSNDYMNVIVQAFAHVEGLRNYFLLLQEKPGVSELVKRLGLLIRKIWNPRAFKGHVSPHEFIQEVANVSKKRFRLDVQSDPLDLISWLLNTLHLGFTNGKRNDSSIIRELFQGELIAESQDVIAVQDEGNKNPVFAFRPDEEIKSSKMPFLFLTLSLPPVPLFMDENEGNIIPQVPISSLLEKYDGKTVTVVNNSMKRYKVSKLPKYLIFCIKRFSKNNFTEEKNPTIVNFPIKNLEVGECSGIVMFMNQRSLLQAQFRIDLSLDQQEAQAKYDLVANICHEGEAKGIQGIYKVHVHCKAKDQWYQIQDLFVEEMMAPMIILSESYIQIWERKE